MKKKWVAVGALLIVVLFVTASILSEYGKADENAVKINSDYLADCQSMDDDKWEELGKEGVIVLENDGYRLEMDAVTTRFTVTDKQSGVVYNSYPEGEINWGSEEVRRRSSSNISVMYYGETYAEEYMGSCEDAVLKEQFTIKRLDDTLRITYVLGDEVQDVFAPYIIPQDVFEERILEQIESNSDKRSMRRYYKLYTEEEKPSDYEEVTKKYPFLKKTPCYVLTRTNESVMQEITKYIKETDYTEEEYSKFRDKHGFGDAAVSVPVGYTIPLELTLNEDGFTATVLSDKIKTHNADFPLCNLYVLEFFDCADSTVSGSYLVPDGSGAIIPFNQNGQTSYVQKLYGDDYAQIIETQQQLSRNATMPIIGKMSDAGNYIMVIEGGAEAASVNVQTAGTLSPVNKGFATFEMTVASHTSLGDRRGMSNYILYSDHVLYENPQLRYIFADNGSVSGFADIYRNYLSATGELEYGTGEEELPLYLDFLCMTTTKEEFVGISYTKKHVLSSLTDIISVVKEMQAAGIDNLRVRLRGWTDGGLYHGAVDKCKIDSAIGSERQLEELASLLSSKGGSLYLDADFTFSYKNAAFDSFKKAKHTVKQIERNVAIFPNFDLVTSGTTNKYQKAYLISPTVYPLYAERFINSFEKQDFSKNVGLSWGAAGQYIHSDFRTDGNIDRCQSANYIKTVLAQMSDAASRVMTDYGNAYSWAGVDDIVAVPSSNSQFVSESEAVPFLQMVLSGSISYAGQPLNLDRSKQTQSDLYSNLSAPYFVLITADNRQLEKADLHHKYYSLQLESGYILETYKSVRETFGDCYGARIVDYGRVSENVTETVMENGTVLTVNHGEAEMVTEKGVLSGYGVKVTK